MLYIMIILLSAGFTNSMGRVYTKIWTGPNDSIFIHSFICKRVFPRITIYFQESQVHQPRIGHRSSSRVYVSALNKLLNWNQQMVEAQEEELNGGIEMQCDASNHCGGSHSLKQGDFRVPGTLYLKSMRERPTCMAWCLV
jgi:hypothetical protein